MATIDRERAENLYNAENYESNTDSWEDGASEFRAKAFLQALNDAGITPRLQSLLDVGCGSGGVIMKLKNMLQAGSTGAQAKFHGIDLSPKAISIARRLYPSATEMGVSFENRTIESLQSETPYTVVSLIHVLEHCPDMLEMLSICESKAKYIYLNVPIEVNLFYTARRKVLEGQYLRYGHLHFFNESFFLTWLKQNGFEVLSTVYSADFEVKKPGLGYRTMQWLRRVAGKSFGPATATWLLGGFSLGVLVKCRQESQ